MKFTQLHLSRRSLAIVAGLIGTLSLAIGAHAALSIRALDATSAVATDQAVSPAAMPSRLALVVGNGHYPDAGEPLAQPINDARALTQVLRRDGFDVDVVEDATRDDLRRAIERLTSRIKPGAVVMLFFGGYAVQSGGESYMIPVDATIWKERDVRRVGVSIESVLQLMNEQGARARLAVLDGSRRNPFERRFRAFSHGLAPISPPSGALILSSTSPGEVVADGTGQNSILVTELLNHLDSREGVVDAFNQTRLAISRASNGSQVPEVSSSLLEDVRLSDTKTANAAD